MKIWESESPPKAASSGDAFKGLSFCPTFASEVEKFATLFAQIRVTNMVGFHFLKKKIRNILITTNKRFLICKKMSKRPRQLKY